MAADHILKDDQHALIDALVQDAALHDAECEDAGKHAEDCHHRQCAEYRWQLVSSLMFDLGLDLTDLGFIASELSYILAEVNAAQESEPETKDDVLEAGEISL